MDGIRNSEFLSTQWVLLSQSARETLFQNEPCQDQIKDHFNDQDLCRRLRESCAAQSQLYQVIAFISRGKAVFTIKSLTEKAKMRLPQ